MVTKTELVNFLRTMKVRVAKDELPVARVANGHPQFDWASLGQAECITPGLDVGQSADNRYATDGTEGLHEQSFPALGVVDFHLDESNACSNPVGHLDADTRATEFAIGSAVLSLFFAKSWKHVAGAAVAGFAAGAHVPKRPKRRYFWLQ